MANDNNSAPPTARQEALAKLRDVLVKNVPDQQAALEIFDAVTDLEVATLNEAHAGFMAAFDRAAAERAS